jgi:hypothetical protein
MLEYNIHGPGRKAFPVAESIRLSRKPSLIRIAQHVKDFILAHASLAEANQGVLIKGDGLATENILLDNASDCHGRPISCASASQRRMLVSLYLILTRNRDACELEKRPM